MTIKIDEGAERISALESALEVAESQITDLILRIEDVGWRKLGDYGDFGPQLPTLHKMVEKHYDMLAANPILGRGIRVRGAYVWGQGVEIQPENKVDADRNVLKKIKRVSNVFTRAQQQQLEEMATATGNIFFLVRRNGSERRVQTVPLRQITGAIYEQDRIDGVKLFLREWTETIDGRDVKKEMAYLHRHAEYDMKTVTVDNREVPVAPKTERIVHVKFNAPEEWTFGVPDLYGTSFWAHSYKDAMESDIKFKEALARYAWKITSPTSANAKNAASQVAMTPGVGGTAAMTEGTQLSAVNRSGAQVDFNDNWALAAIIAAGFDVPLNELLYQQGATASDALSETSVAVLSTRQEVWCEALEVCLDLLGVPSNVFMPRLFAEPVHRVAQAISVLASTNTLHASEIREASLLQLKRYGVQNFKDTLPKKGAWQEFTQGLNDNPGTPPLNTPSNDDNSRSPAGALADGDNELRDNDEG